MYAWPLISLSAHPDPERFVSEFSGSERTVAGYLLTEVLERQPPEARELLLRTCLLERVSGPLADVLTGGPGAEATLQRLEDQNAFVTSLDAARSWFRYHHLFADLLRLELRRLAPETIPSLHRAAAAWHEQEGDVVEAVRHHQAAGDWAPAARLLRGQLPDADHGRPGRDAPCAARGVPGRCASGRRKSRGCAGDRQHRPRPARRGGRPPGRRSAAGGGDSGGETARLRRVRGRRRGRARPPAKRSIQGAGSDSRAGSRTRRRGRDGRAAGAARLLGTRAPEPGDRRTVGRASPGRATAPRGRPRPHAPDLTALHRGRLPRASRDHGAAHRAAAAARARAERARDRDCRGTWLDGRVDDDRRVRDGRHGARADGSRGGRRAPSRSRGRVAARGSRPGDRGPAPPRPRHAALRGGPLR